MSITPTTLTRAAGLCAAAAGAIFIAVQINHPPADVEHVVRTEMLVRESAKAVMAVLALIGFTGMYLRQVRRIGVFGLVGFGLLAAGYLALFAIQCIIGFVLPTIAESDPAFVQRVLHQAVGGPASGRIGHLNELLMISGMGYALGGLVFGVALFRANVLARWASALLALSTVSALALAVLPESFNRPFAVPMGIALIGLGLSLCRSVQHAEADAETVVPGEPAAVR